VVRFSTLGTGYLYLQLISMVLIFDGGRVDPRAIVRREGGDVTSTSRKFRVTPTIIKWQVVFPNLKTDFRMDILCVNFTVQMREIIKCNCEFNICMKDTFFNKRVRPTVYRKFYPDSPNNLGTPALTCLEPVPLKQ
jgi:hypothetical protein